MRYRALTMRVDLDERPGSPQSTNEPGEIGAARLGRRRSCIVATKATAVEELLQITEPRSEKTEGIVWEEV